jgi:hypothetical protein
MRMGVGKDLARRAPLATSGTPTHALPERESAQATPAQLRQIDAPTAPPAVQRLVHLQQVADGSPGVARLQQLSRLPPAHAAAGQAAQRMPWPTGRKARSPKGEDLWAEAETDELKELYEWCDTTDQFEAVMAAVTYDTWSGLKQVVKADMDNFASEVDAGADLKGYFQSKKRSGASKAKPSYDPSTYAFCSGTVVRLLGERNLTRNDLDAPWANSFRELIEIADKAIAELEWRKQASAGGAKERGAVNKLIAEHEGRIAEQAELMAADKQSREQEAARTLARTQGIQAVETAAANIPAYAQVTANPLALAVWQAAKNFAGSSGYLEVSKTIYPKATVTAATAALRAFGFGWTATHGESQYMTNPHCPGQGQPEDKSTHSNPELRTSKFQANFISQWGGATQTVIHINADSL